MFSKYLAALFCAASLSSAAHADEEYILSVEPGMYALSGMAKIDEVPFGSRDQYCVEPEMATMSLQDFIGKFHALKECDLQNINAIEHGYSFTMVCAGNVPGTVDGQLETKEGAVTLTAAGMANMFGLGEVPLSLEANAVHTGVCAANG